ncbi:helix-turn-helix domain-containing protein [Streptomyces avicenniae]|uniref:helix-turn-helix domain-containing protein n=1 Tax=Streptomyces avicenniae TaxID=500153 RepID=UPI000A7A5C11|nr:helix-turn-helix transcriptional regulator [Streptomyces avicenniae]
MATELEYEEKRDPAVSTLAYFGKELKLCRERARISQQDLANEVPCHHTLINKIETATRIPSLRIAQVCDEVLATDGAFERMWPIVIKYAFPSWFRPFVDLEEKASLIRNFQLIVVPGLLQTEEYARAVLASGRPENLEDVVAARMRRQHILHRIHRPRLWVIMEEAALSRPVGSRDVMYRQVRHLIQAAEEPRTVVQVIPRKIATHAGIAGPFSLLSFEDKSPHILYSDGFPQGSIHALSEDVAIAEWAYDLLRADALPPVESIELMDRIAKELYA